MLMKVVNAFSDAGSTPAASTTLLNLLSMSYEICGGPSPRSRRSLLALKVEAARQAACASLTSTFNQYVWIDTFVQWIRRRASANLALNSHSL